MNFFNHEPADDFYDISLNAHERLYGDDLLDWDDYDETEYGYDSWEEY